MIQLQTTAACPSFFNSGTRFPDEPKEIDLATFYHPAQVKDGDGRRAVTTIDEVCPVGNVLIRGTVGQGKSILLRYLAATELVKGARVPLFLELRRIEPNRTIVQHALEEAKTLGLEMTEEILLCLFANGKALLLLDAFDEVHEDHRQALITELETLSKRCEGLRIIATSRPDAGLEASPHFRVVDLAPLLGDEYVDVLRRMSGSDELTDRVAKSIEHSPVRRMLTTPLMVALLLVRYRIDQSIPENQRAFYEDLFSLLLRRHDKTKAGYVRPRKSGSTDFQLKSLFDAVCFMTRQDANSRLMLTDLYSFADRASQSLSLNVDATLGITDIIEITCLIADEGGVCSFIHKSVQEFHAAAFVKDQPSEVATKFYDGMKERFSTWDGELRFLEEIDRFRFTQRFLLPDLQRTSQLLAEAGAEQKPMSSSAVKRIVSSVLHLVAIEVGTGRRPTVRSAVYSVPRLTTWSLRNFSVSVAVQRSQYLEGVVEHRFEPLSKKEKPSRKVNTPKVIRISTTELLAEKSGMDLLRAVCEEFSDGVRLNLEECERFVNDVVDRQELIKF